MSAFKGHFLSKTTPPEFSGEPALVVTLCRFAYPSLQAAVEGILQMCEILKEFMTPTLPAPQNGYRRVLKTYDFLGQDEMEINML